MNSPISSLDDPAPLTQSQLRLLGGVMVACSLSIPITAYVHQQVEDRTEAITEAVLGHQPIILSGKISEKVRRSSGERFIIINKPDGSSSRIEVKGDYQGTGEITEIGFNRKGIGTDIKIWRYSDGTLYLDGIVSYCDHIENDRNNPLIFSGVIDYILKKNDCI